MTDEATNRAILDIIKRWAPAADEIRCTSERNKLRCDLEDGHPGAHKATRSTEWFPWGFEWT